MKSKAILIAPKAKIKAANYANMPVITINNETIEYVECVKYLGFNFDREFSMQNHIDSISKKVYFSLSQLYPLRRSLPTSIKLSLFKSLILPLFDYMDVVYNESDSHGSGINKVRLQKLFNSGIRFIYNLKRNDHVTPSIIKSNILPLEFRREIHSLLMAHKIVNKKCPEYLTNTFNINQNNTRAKSKILIKKTINNFHKKSFGVSMPKIWNSLSEEMRNKGSIKAFHKALKELYFNKFNKQKNT